MDGANCGECHGPLQCDGNAKPVALFPCGHLLHSHCSLYVRKTAKLSLAQYCCPTCGTQVFDSITLFVSESEDAKDEAADCPDGEGTDAPLDVNALLTRIFHFQRRNLMHQRQILESKIELKSVQASLASVHQQKSDLERRYDFTAVSMNTDQVKEIPQGDMMGCIVSTHDEVEQLKQNVARLRAVNQVSRRTLSQAKAALQIESTGQTTQLVTLAPRLSLRTSSEGELPLPFPTRTAAQSSQIGAKRPRLADRDVDIIDVDASSDDEVCVMDTGHPRLGTQGDTDEVLEVVRRTIDKDDEDLPPLFPVRAPVGMPPMGVSFNRSVRDLPRSTDALVQRTLR